MERLWKILRRVRALIDFNFLGALWLLGEIQGCVEGKSASREPGEKGIVIMQARRDGSFEPSVTDYTIGKGKMLLTTIGNMENIALVNLGLRCLPDI